MHTRERNIFSTSELRLKQIKFSRNWCVDIALRYVVRCVMAVISFITGTIEPKFLPSSDLRNEYKTNYILVRQLYCIHLAEHIVGVTQLFVLCFQSEIEKNEETSIKTGAKRESELNSCNELEEGETKTQKQQAQRQRESNDK